MVDAMNRSDHLVLLAWLWTPITNRVCHCTPGVPGQEAKRVSSHRRVSLVHWVSVSSLIMHAALTHSPDLSIPRCPVLVLGLGCLLLPVYGSRLSPAKEPGSGLRLFSLLSGPGCAVWAPAAVMGIIVPFLSCSQTQAKGGRENKNITVRFFRGQSWLTHAM